ncbi:hypothetical protein IV203_032114 [Nitzschia inconspicua]|uniref:Uncharacterized protein n=1 Tax=Nitzschia inconspicua TaxID=303405 RepID=A0A9K3Q387_9STRA|nr:hypothetical protein IV203_032114 [Nitzschia inconspicua]
MQVLRERKERHFLSASLPSRLEKFGTNFESFTHHSIDIRFWTVSSRLDPSELNEDELNRLMKNTLFILNYNIELVEKKAVAAMEHHHENAVVMTQEMHNCSADVTCSVLLAFVVATMALTSSPKILMLVPGHTGATANCVATKT